MKNILITGGAGFIGSHLVRLMVNKYEDYKIVNLDALTYAGNLANLQDIQTSANYEFVKGDITDYWHTYKLPIMISNCSNNYGPYQFPEKLIPLMINNIKHGKSLPIYGDGKYTRDWLWVADHASAIDTIFHKGRLGETYNIGGDNEWQNIDLVNELCDIVDDILGREVGSARKTITFVKDRPGHDLRYAIDASKLKNELGWSPTIQAMEGLRKTAEWYLSNSEWMENVTSGNYQKYYESMYAER